MSKPIEHYALISNTRGAALVCQDGSIDWLCLPRFDSPACLAALLGRREHGRWMIAPQGEVMRVQRRYRSRTLVLETELHTAEGSVRLVDCMPTTKGRADIFGDAGSACSSPTCIMAMLTWHALPTFCKY